MDLEINFSRDEKGGKWEAKDPQDESLIAYMSFIQAAPNKIIIDHTIVPKEFSMKGTGKALLREAIAYMREKGLKTMPTCSFVLSQLKKYQEWHDVLDPSQVPS